MKLITIPIFWLFITVTANAQSYVIPSNPTLEYLINIKKDIGTISNTEKIDLVPFFINKTHFNISYIKNNKGLYAIIDGTGKVFEAKIVNKKGIQFTRIDSTVYFGNNFGSINFSFKDTLYSFGGYGFWNRNGQLRHFNSSGEWSIDKLNEEIKIMSSFYSFSKEESKMYYVQFPWKEEASNTEINKSSVYVLNVADKTNKFLGELNPKINLSFKYFTIDIPSLKGLLNYNERDIYLYKFSKNKVYKLINSKIKDELIGKAGSELQMTFENEGKIYFSYNNDTTLKSFSISMNDFSEESYPIYINKDQNLITWIILFIIASVISSIILIKKRYKKKTPIIIEKEENQIIDLNSNEFNTIEKLFINKLIEKSKTGSHLTVEELNTILGIKKKTIEIQKRVRTEAINRINHKFNVNYNLETTFIERKRSSEDRRYFHYVISKENARIYQGL